MTLNLVINAENNLFLNSRQEEEPHLSYPILRSMTISSNGNIMAIDSNIDNLVFLDRNLPYEIHFPIVPHDMKFVACLFPKMSSSKLYALKAEKHNDEWTYELNIYEITENSKLSLKDAADRTLPETTKRVSLGSLCELPGERLLATCSSMKKIYLFDFQKIELTSFEIPVVVNEDSDKYIHSSMAVIIDKCDHELVAMTFPREKEIIICAMIRSPLEIIK